MAELTQCEHTLHTFIITVSDFLVAHQSHELVIINENQAFNLHTVSGLE